MLAEHGRRGGMGLVPALIGVGADDDYVQMVTVVKNGLPGRAHTTEPTSCVQRLLEPLAPPAR